MSPILEVENLAKRFGGVVATDHVSLTVDAGAMVTIIGPNGAGKSTFFSLLCGLVRPDTGKIVFDGHSIGHLPAFARARLGVGLTFQTNRTFSDLPIRENLAVPMTDRRSEDAEERYRYALDLFELDEADSTPVREIPHHKRQWLEILMVLAGGPRLILIDEPTAGMSPEETSQTAKVLRHLNETGLTIVVVEHDIAFVRELDARVIVLHQGRVFADGPVSEVIARHDVRDIYLGRG